LYRVSAVGLAAGSAFAATPAAVNTIGVVLGTTAVDSAVKNLRPGVAQFLKVGGEDRTIHIASVAASVITLGGAGDGATSFISAAVANTEAVTFHQIHDFTDDSVGEITGGELATAATTSGRSVNQQYNADCVVAQGATGLNTLTASTLGNAAVGDTISVAFVGANVNNGYYKVSGVTGTTAYTLEGHVTTTGSQACVVKIIAASPCTVTETQRGTSENTECSSRGNCDGQTGLCTCFSGYVGEDCSTQTVLV